MRFVLSESISSETHFEIIDPAAGCAAMVQKLEQKQPDILLIGAEIFNKCANSIFDLVHQINIAVLIVQEKKHRSIIQKLSLPKNMLTDTLLIPDSQFLQPSQNFKAELLQKIRHLNYRKNLSEMYVPAPDQKPLKPVLRSKNRLQKMVVIGASTGGTQAIELLIRQLQDMKNTVLLIAVHLPSNFTKTFAKRLNELTPLKVAEGKHGMKLEAGTVIIAPGGKNMEIAHTMGSYDNLIVSVTKDENFLSHDQPSIDKLMLSAARYGKENLLGIILTGMGADGSLGAAAISNAGGKVIAQDKESSVIFGMAKSAIDTGFVNEILPLQQIGDYINNFTAINRKPGFKGQANAADEIERAGI